MMKQHITKRILGYHHWCKYIDRIHGLQLFQIEVGHNIVISHGRIVHISMKLDAVVYKFSENCLAYIFTITQVDTFEKYTSGIFGFQKFKLIGVRAATP